MKWTARYKGFSLVEVLVSLALAGLLIISLSTLFLSGYDKVISAAESTAAAALAQGELEKIKARDYAELRELVGSGNSYKSGEIQEGKYNITYSLTLVTEEYLVAGISYTPELLLLEVTVTWHRGRERKRLLAVYLAEGLDTG